MNVPPFVPPHIEPPDEETVKKIVNMSRKDHKEFQKSYAYKKYVQPTLAREKKLRRQKRIEWWWTKGIPILNTILALIAAITGIIALLR